MAGLMSDEHKEILRENSYKLSQYINMDASLWSNMISKGIVAYGDKDRIQRTAQCQSDEVLKLLEILERQPDKAFNSFIRALRECRQGHVAQLLLQKPKHAFHEEVTKPDPEPMVTEEEPWQKALLKLRVFLVGKVDLADTDLWDYLLQEDVCTTMEKQSIVARAPANHEQVRALLDLLQKKTEKAFDSFCVGLHSTGQGHIADTIVPAAKIQDNLETVAKKTAEKQAKNLVDAIKSGEGEEKITKYMIQQFSRKIDFQLDCDTMERLTDLKKSVCCISSSSRIGTGFYVGDGCVLTCWHVIQNLVQRNDVPDVTNNIQDCNADFSQAYGSGAVLYPIKRLVAYCDKLDYALVQLRAEPPGINAICKFAYSPAPHSRVHLIGYPHNSPRRMCDPCCEVVNMELFQNEKREELKDVSDEVKRKVLDQSSLPYHCSFFYGSSGCPVINDDGCVVAIHKHGVINCTVRSEHQYLPITAPGITSLIEHGVKMSAVAQHINENFQNERVCQTLFKGIR